MARTTYVLRNGELVEKHLAQPLSKSGWNPEARADMPVPYIMRDLPGYMSTRGVWIDGRSEHREYLKRNNLVEVGDQEPELETRSDRVKRLQKEAGDLKRDIAETINALENGMVAQPDDKISAHDFGLDALPSNGDIVRADADSGLE